MQAETTISVEFQMSGRKGKVKNFRMCIDVIARLVEDANGDYIDLATKDTRIQKLGERYQIDVTSTKMSALW